MAGAADGAGAAPAPAQTALPSLVAESAGPLLAAASLTIFAIYAARDLYACTRLTLATAPLISPLDVLLRGVPWNSLISSLVLALGAFALDLAVAGRVPSRTAPIVTVTGLALAYACSALGMEAWSTAVLAVVIFLCAPAVTRRVLATTLQGTFSADLVALVALFGSLLLAEYFAAALIVLMLGGGAALEEAAQAQAGVDLDELRQRVPLVVHRCVASKGRNVSSVDTEEVPLAALAVGDLLLVRGGETLPADGTLERSDALLDYAPLTGEPLPVEKRPGDAVLSGALNLRAPVFLRITRRPEHSSFAQLTAELEAALQRPGRLQRSADLLGGLFTPVALAAAAAALLLHRAARPWHAALAVLNAATPCPLLIAVPVATLAGLGVAARRGLLVRSGAALEAAAVTDTLVLDKTGTLTQGRPSLRAVERLPACSLSAAALLAHAAAVEFGSSHLLARAICAAAAAAGPVPECGELVAEAVADLEGQGVAAYVRPAHSAPARRSPSRSRSPHRAVRSSAQQKGSSVRVVVGSARCMAAQGVAAPAGGWPAAEAETLAVYLALNGVLAARLLFHDTLRPEAAAVVAHLRSLGVRRVVLLSGDAAPAVRAAAAAVGADEWHAQCLPRDKAEHVRRLSAAGGVVQFVGDGLNDALALAGSRLGVALSADADSDSPHAAANIAAAAAGVVVLKGSLHRLVALRLLAVAVRRIAMQSAVGGVSASLLVMCAALAGRVAPATGAVAQELVDLIAIGNALRVLRTRVDVR